MLINAVAPFAGAWIEMLIPSGYKFSRIVAPFAGAWIEIIACLLAKISNPVAPFAGAWIEIVHKWFRSDKYSCRSLRGSVD